MSGEGAYRAGGRWNSSGHHVVYAGGTLTLAMLELLVHVDYAEDFLKTGHIYHAVRFSDEMTATLEERSLPSDWDDRPESAVSQAVGDEWLEARVTPILIVPSVITPPGLRYDPLYMNYLMNPLHPEFGEAVEVGSVQELQWDPRLRPVT